MGDIGLSENQSKVQPLPQGWGNHAVKNLAYLNKTNLNSQMNCPVIHYIDIDSVEEGVIKNIKDIDVRSAPSRAKRIVNDKDILISSVRPNLRHYCKIRSPKSCTVASTGFVVLTPKEINPDFLYYSITTKEFTNYLSAIAETSTTAYPSITADVIANYSIACPRENEQRAIAKILSDLDSKIELNRKMNKTLESVAQAIFKHWFINFEFPNEEGKPYKSSGGDMVDSELGEIPIGWRIINLEEIAHNLDSKRIPLSSREREKRKGGYPYYGATGILDYVNDYLFDGVHILMGEDGSVLDEGGHPILQYVWGKFWVNNHAHVLRGKIVSNELLYLFLRGTKISHIVTGAVQQKINQTNMNKLKFVIPPDRTQSLMENFLAQIFEKYRLNFKQNKGLTQIRDILLPKLISGKIRVPVEEKENE